MAIPSAEALETLSREATTDPITGLANYRAFHERLSSEVERSTRHRRALSVAVLDLDHFRRVNDTHGHQIGDDVLAEVARRLADGVRGGELVARIGGEEFAWLMPEATPDGARAAAERVRQAIENTRFDVAGTLTVSIGVCSNEQAEMADELVGRADEALYWSKAGGRNMTSVYARTYRREGAELSSREPALPAQPAAGRLTALRQLGPAEVWVRCRRSADGAGRRRSDQACVIVGGRIAAVRSCSSRASAGTGRPR